MLHSQVAQSRSITPLGREDHLTFRGNLAAGRHGWLRLTPAYSLHVVCELLKGCDPKERVLDPFSGTGTTALAATTLGLRCDAIDVNPFLVWLGRLKVCQFPSDLASQVRTSAAKIAEQAERTDCQEGVWKPDIHQIEKWWEPDTLRELATLYHCLCTSRAVPPAVLDLLKIAFCRVTIQTANVSFGHQSMSFKKPKTTKQPVLFNQSPSMFERFAQAADEVAASLQTEQPKAEANIFHGDSRCISEAVRGHSYDRVITSPPYPNRMSYIRELRPYMYWLGYLSNGRQAGELDWKAIGGTWGCATSLLGTWKADPTYSIQHPQFARITQAIEAKQPTLAKYVMKYFEDAVRHVRSLANSLNAGAKCHYVVGNSKFYDTLLPTEELYAAIFESAGFVSVRSEAIRKRTSKKELYEYIVYAEWPSSRAAARKKPVPRADRKV